MTTRAWGKFQGAMSQETWIRMDTIVRVSNDQCLTVKLHLIDGSVLDVRAGIPFGAEALKASELLTKVLLRDLTATKTRALTDYTGAVK